MAGFLELVRGGTPDAGGVDRHRAQFRARVVRCPLRTRGGDFYELYLAIMENIQILSSGPSPGVPQMTEFGCWSR